MSMETDQDDDVEGLTEPERTELSRWIVKDGDRIVSEVTGASRSTVVRALAGLGVRRGSLLLIRNGLRGR